MLLTRRTLLATAAPAALALAAAGCTTNPTTGQPELDPTVIDAIQSAVNTVAQYVPTVESIVSTAASLFGPGYVAIVQVGTTAFNTLVQALQSIVSSLTPSASAKLRARLKASTAGNPVKIGVVNGVTVMGYRA